MRCAHDVEQRRLTRLAPQVRELEGSNDFAIREKREIVPTTGAAHVLEEDDVPARGTGKQLHGS
jgi:hypothetical protein